MEPEACQTRQAARSQARKPGWPMDSGEDDASQGSLLQPRFEGQSAWGVGQSAGHLDVQGAPPKP